MDGVWQIVTIATQCRSVLVVEDDALVRDVIGAILSELGYTVRLVANGPEALQCLAEQSFGAALIDLMMYPMSGDEVANRAVALQPDLRIVIMSGHGADVLDNYTLPEYTFLPKPFSSSALEFALNSR